MRIPTKATLAGLMALAAGVAGAQENAIRHDMDTVNRHFEIATHDFGGGRVQMHSRSEGPDGVEHTIREFDCGQGSYNETYSGASAPTVFPVDADSRPSELPFPLDDNIGPLAQHACGKYGQPVAQW
ncbi:hypothetical protein AB9K41_07230 [Cribrihabitans sp. XS_ASV171]